VGKDGFDLVGRELREQRVEEDDAPGTPEPYDGGVRGAALSRLVGDEDADGGHADASREREETITETGVRKRREPIKQRDDPDRQHGGHGDLGGDEDGRGREPPERGPRQ